jgi:hypothetical protein
MPEDIKKEQAQIPQEMKLVAEPRGKYTVLNGNKVYQFDFPINAKLGENYDIISYIRNELWTAMENERKKEQEKQKEHKIPE